MASAQRSRADYMDTASAIAKIGLSAKDAFSNMDEVIGFTELINKSFVNNNADVQEQRGAMIQLTQAMASGVLRGDECGSMGLPDYMDYCIGDRANCGFCHIYITNHRHYLLA